MRPVFLHRLTRHWYLQEIKVFIFISKKSKGGKTSSLLSSFISGGESKNKQVIIDKARERLDLTLLSGTWERSI